MAVARLEAGRRGPSWPVVELARGGGSALRLHAMSLDTGCRSRGREKVKRKRERGRKRDTQIHNDGGDDEKDTFCEYTARAALEVLPDTGARQQDALPGDS